MFTSTGCSSIKANNDLVVVYRLDVRGGTALQAQAGRSSFRARTSISLPLPRRHRHRRRPPAPSAVTYLADCNQPHRIADMDSTAPTGNRRDDRVAPPRLKIRGDARAPSSSSCRASWAATSAPTAAASGSVASSRPRRPQPHRHRQQLLGWPKPGLVGMAYGKLVKPARQDHRSELIATGASPSLSSANWPG